MREEVVVVRMNPWWKTAEAGSFGTHLFNSLQGRRDRKPDKPGIYQMTDDLCEGQLARWGNVGFQCTKCHQTLYPHDHSAKKLDTLWAWTSLQLVAANLGLNCRNSKLLPEPTDIFRLPYGTGENLKGWFWKYWGGANHLTVVQPEYEVAVEEVMKAVFELVPALAAIHSSSIKEASNDAQSAFGWLYQD
jgi:hypothetical protein